MHDIWKDGQFLAENNSSDKTEPALVPKTLSLLSNQPIVSTFAMAHLISGVIIKKQFD